MNHHQTLTFPALFSDTCSKFGNHPALSTVGEKPITYIQLKDQINATIAFLEKLGIKSGDKVAILSSNMPNWGITYYAITFMGAVAVPLLPDFQTAEIENILNHSESKVIFVSLGLISRMNGVSSDYLKHVVRIEDYVVIDQDDPEIFNPNSVPAKQYTVAEDDLAAIIYTSGTTGRSKGVMLTHKNISFNAVRGRIIQPIFENDRFLSILPLAHTYENTLGLILPMLCGSCVYYIGKTPSPSVLLPALKEVKPTLMLTVPLIIEKIYHNRIEPKFNSSKLMRLIYSQPFLRKKLNKIAGKKLYETFGGELKFFGIGGAKLNPKVEQFLIEAGFPYAIGYGLTETSPLLAGANPTKIKFESTGPAIKNIELIIHNPDENGEGEIWAKGPNVMKGYFKDPEQTAKVLNEDGWFKTGDLGKLDKDNYLYIRGRLKNMILGASGKNIYPEEIESVINNYQHVLESLVIEQKGKLVAFVHFNRDEIEERYKHLKSDLSEYVENFIDEHKKGLQDYVNSRVNKYSQIQTIVNQPQPFQKTATQKIKRFLYS